MANQTIDGDLRVIGALQPNTIIFPNDGIQDAAVSSLANLDAAKLRHQHAVRYSQPLGADVISESEVVHIVKAIPLGVPADSKIVAVEVVCSTAPTGGDKQFTVDVQVGNESTGYATILSGVITVDNTNVNREIIAGVVSSGTTSQGDSVLMIITASGSTGSQAQGLNVMITSREGA